MCSFPHLLAFIHNNDKISNRIQGQLKFQHAVCPEDNRAITSHRFGPSWLWTVQKTTSEVGCRETILLLLHCAHRCRREMSQQRFSSRSPVFYHGTFQRLEFFHCPPHSAVYSAGVKNSQTHFLLFRLKHGSEKHEVIQRVWWYPSPDHRNGMEVRSLTCKVRSPLACFGFRLF